MNRDMFGRHYIVITSTGRTGTHFLGTKMSEMIEGCTSVHEPDVMKLSEPRLWPEKVRHLGLFDATVGKFLTKRSMANLGVARANGSLPDDEIVKCMRRLRTRLFTSEQSPVLLEANGILCGLVELLPSAFPNVRVVYIIRDPRDWLASWMSWAKSPAATFNIRLLFKNTRITPFNFEGDPYQKTWDTMGLFERFCWWWAKRNGLAVEQAQKTGAMVYRFEDLFGGKRDEAFPEMLRYVTSFPDGSSARWEYKPELFSEKTNRPKRKNFPKWNEWSADRARRFNEHCSALMEQFGYGNEPAWKEKISSL